LGEKASFKYSWETLPPVPSNEAASMRERENSPVFTLAILFSLLCRKQYPTILRVLYVMLLLYCM